MSECDNVIARETILDYSLAFCISQASEPVSKLAENTKNAIINVDFVKLAEEGIDAAHQYPFFDFDETSLALMLDFKYYPQEIKNFIRSYQNNLQHKEIEGLYQIASWLENAEFVISRRWEDPDYVNTTKYWGICKTVELLGKEASEIKNELMVIAPQIHWESIIQLRNMIRHEIDKTVPQDLYNFIADDIPSLINIVKSVIDID